MSTNEAPFTYCKVMSTVETPFKKARFKKESRFKKDSRFKKIAATTNFIVHNCLI